MENKMNDYNQEYFYVKKDGLDKYPSLAYVRGGGNYVEVDKPIPLDVSTKRTVCFKGSAIKSPQLADFHKLKHYAPVLSERLKNVLEGFNLKEVQYLPTLIRDNRGVEHDGFYILHVYNEIKCMDWEKSIWEKNRYSEENPDIEKLVLDNALLDKVPLEERLVFMAWEDPSHLLYHQSVVERMLEISPTGFTIYRLSKYDPDLPFIEEYMKNRGL